jgi:hypothetical protein
MTREPTKTALTCSTQDAKLVTYGSVCPSRQVGSLRFLLDSEPTARLFLSQPYLNRGVVGDYHQCGKTFWLAATTY